MTERRCENCEFCHRAECHKNAPTTCSPLGRWPRVEYNEWCGEFKEKSNED